MRFRYSCKVLKDCLEIVVIVRFFSGATKAIDWAPFMGSLVPEITLPPGQLLRIV